MKQMPRERPAKSAPSERPDNETLRLYNQHPTDFASSFSAASTRCGSSVGRLRHRDLLRLPPSADREDRPWALHHQPILPCPIITKVADEMFARYGIKVYEEAVEEVPESPPGQGRPGRYVATRKRNKSYRARRKQGMPPPPPQEALNPPQEALDPPQEALDPPQEALDPPQEALNPPQEALNPPQEALDPLQEALDPPQEALDPPQEALDPPQEALDPLQEALDPQVPISDMSASYILQRSMAKASSSEKC